MAQLHLVLFSTIFCPQVLFSTMYLSLSTFYYFSYVVKYLKVLSSELTNDDYCVMHTAHSEKVGSSQTKVDLLT